MVGGTHNDYKTKAKRGEGSTPHLSFWRENSRMFKQPVRRYSEEGSETSRTMKDLCVALGMWTDGFKIAHGEDAHPCQHAFCVTVEDGHNPHSQF